MNRDIQRLQQKTFDILVVGGGIHGACVARDAALRGLSVALVEKNDFSSATSHNSLKTIHGGIRYLQHLNIKRTLESITEQKTWLRTAPQLVRPLPFVMPTYGHGMRGPEVMWAGITMFDLLGLGKNKHLQPSSRLPRGGILGRDECLEKFGFVQAERLTGAALWYDAQVSYADRAALLLLNDACIHGAQVANYCEALRLEVDQSSSRVNGVEARCHISQSEFTINANLVITTTGPWASEFLGNSNQQKPLSIDVPLTKSMNIVCNRPALDMAVGMESKHVSDSKLGSTKRLYFNVPWLGVSILGTTHFPHKGNADSLCVRESEVPDFVEELNSAFKDLDLKEDEVLYCYTGLTPADDGSVKNATRLHHSKIIDHSVDHSLDGLISIVSVKWTTARGVAERATDLAIKKLQHKGTSPCVTRERLIPDLAEVPLEVDEPGADAFAAYCKSHIKSTMALDLSDILLRRTNKFVLNQLTSDELKAAVSTLQAELSIDPVEMERQIDKLKSTGLPSHRLKVLHNTALLGQ